MNLFIIFVIAFIVFAQKAIAQDTQCTLSHEKYNECGTACPITCENYKQKDEIMCTEQCVSGCYCESPYVRKNNSSCVLENECESETQVSQPTATCTRLHEKYNSCGSACPSTCENYDNPPICTKQCKPGCYCESPYIKDIDGSCVLKSECKPKVIEPQKPYYKLRCKGRHEIYDACGTLCPKTCATKDIMFKCRSGCQSGCFCAPGYLRNSKNRCVLIRRCD